MRPRKWWTLALCLCLVVGLMNLGRILRFVYPLCYEELVYEHAQTERIDPFLVAAVILVESNCNPTAKSVKGAQGLMQIMPETAAWVAEQTSMNPFRHEMLNDPATNVKMGTWYLAHLLKEFSGETTLALAAYNAGQGNVRKWLRDGIWSGEENTVDDIPFPETRTYVRRVSHAWDRYGFIHGKKR